MPPEPEVTRPSGTCKLDLARTDRHSTTLREANDGTELVTLHTVVPEKEGRALLHAVTEHLSSLEVKVNWSEIMHRRFCDIQQCQTEAFEEYGQNQ